MNTKQLPYVGATPEQLEHHLVREFLGIHNMFRRELENIQRFVETLLATPAALHGPQARQYVEGLAAATYRYTHYLHFHHHGESAQLFPALRQEGLDDAVIGRLVAEHNEIGTLIDNLNRTLRAVAEIDPRAINSDLQRLAELLQTHLAYEESHVCPLLTHFSHWPMHA